MRLRLLNTLAALLVCSTFASAQLVTSIVPDGKIHKFEARDKNFWIDGQKTLLVSGEMHFGRVQLEDWDTRIKQAKAMGLNTISFYLFWNLCEPEEGKFVFSGMSDVRRVLQLCQENGMWAILRPGPYCCAEVEYGGIPYWTLKYPEVPIRSTHPKWLEWSKRYIEQVYKQVGDLQVTKGGPLLMVQMDNEFGMIGRGDNSYIAELQKIFEGVGFDTQLFVCESGGPGGASMPGVLRGPNGYTGARAGRGGNNLAIGPSGPSGFNGTTQPAAAVEYPTFVPEVYTNWFTAWGGPMATRFKSVEQVTNWASNLIDQNVSFNFYVFHGGTTYGFWNGCNEYLPLVNSYDYGAPVDEAGRITDKYKALREVLSSKLGITPPQPPPDSPVIEIAPFNLTEHMSMLETLPATPTKVAAKPVSMENLDQDYGFVLYRKKFNDGLSGTLVLKNPMDLAIVMVNGKKIAEAFRGYGPESNTITLPQTSGPATLDIVVYNLGRISVITAPWTQDRARKGLIDGASLNGTDLADWEMYSLPYTNGPKEFKPSTTAHTGPTFYRGTFNVTETGGTYLDMRNWKFGAVWVNGHNLGRFWDRGALRSLFVPRNWLKSGANEVVVLELDAAAPEHTQLSGVPQIVSEKEKPFAVRLDQPASFGPPGARRGGGRFGRGGRGATTAPTTQQVGG
jgi:beta-galactosidase